MVAPQEPYPTLGPFYRPTARNDPRGIYSAVFESREQLFIALIKSRVPGIEVKDLSPALDAMRAIKSAQEIAVIE